jgi:LysM repeat protein
MRRLVSILTTFLTLSAQAQSPQAVADYIARYKAIAIEEMNTYGIPASVTLAQGIHESGCGMSKLALNSNNHFGIKCHEEWTGERYHHDDDAPQECFRVYKSPEESFRDHSEFLKNRPRYASLFKLETNDYKGWARGLKAAGYATNPQYPQIIIKLVEDFHLSEYDRPGAGSGAATAQSKPAEAKPVVVVDPVQQQIEKEIRKQAEQNKYQFSEILINGVKAVSYSSKVPVEAIAQKYDLTVDQLYALNDLPAGKKFKENEFVYVEKRKPETSYYQYEIAQGETMRDVAQKFGISLEDLYKRNGIASNCEPVAGEIVVLRGKREVPLRFRVVGGTTTPQTMTTTTSMTEPKPTDTKVHKVGETDTLYSIAKQYNVAVDSLMRINNLNGTDIKIGQTLIVSL